MDNLKYVGKPVVRIDGKEKVSGSTLFTDDLEYGPNMLYAALVESSEAHALIKNIDTSEAEKYPGVIKVFTGKDFPYKFGLYMKDRYIFAMDKVRFVGEQIAAVVSRDKRIAERAVKLVKVEYEPLPAIFDQMESLKEDAVLIHPDLGEYIHVPWFFPRAKTNIAHWRKTRRGDVEKGFAEADYILEDTYRVPRYAQAS